MLSFCSNGVATLLTIQCLLKRGAHLKPICIKVSLICILCDMNLKLTAMTASSTERGKHIGHARRVNFVLELARQSRSDVKAARFNHICRVSTLNSVMTE